MIRVKQLLNKLKHFVVSGMLWSYFNKKNFSQDQKVNRRNDKWYNVMLLHFFPQGVSVNAIAYIDMLDTVLKSWIEGMT